jgi:hypothetical protein
MQINNHINQALLQGKARREMSVTTRYKSDFGVYKQLITTSSSHEVNRT